MPGVTYYLQTFGCKSNQYESQALREALDARGHVETDDPAKARLFVVNTCAVTGRAGASCRNAIRKTLRANPSLRVVVTGCGVDLNERWPDLPGEPLFVPNSQKRLLVRWLDDAPPAPESDVSAPRAVDGERDGRFDLSISRFRGHTRAFVKIQDGCDNFCSYCAVPHARGRPASRPAGEVLEEARRLVGNGHAELVLTGINIGAYRRPGTALPDLVARLAALPGLVRLRLGSVEPPYLTPELVAAMADNAGVCPHVHLPLQSGDDRVLSLMRRRYTAGEFLEKAAMLRERLVLPAVTTDVIVGFPGEDGEAADATLAVCRAAGFSRLHVFLFSPRPGTPAAAMRRTATDAQIEARKTRLIALGGELSRAFAAACVGLRERVIVENSGSGHTDRYVKARIDGGKPGETVAVTVTGAEGEEARTEVVGGVPGSAG